MYIKTLIHNDHIEDVRASATYVVETLCTPGFVDVARYVNCELARHDMQSKSIPITEITTIPIIIVFIWAWGIIRDQ